MVEWFPCKAYGFDSRRAHQPHHTKDTMNEQLELFNELPPAKRAGRGLGKKPAMQCTSIRLPKDVLEFFDVHYPNSKQAKIRQVLTDYIAKQ